MNTQKQMINNFKKVCICRSVTGGTIMKAIQDGCLTFESLRRTLRVGTGTCKAKRCRSKIEDQLKTYKESIDPSSPDPTPSKAGV